MMISYVRGEFSGVSGVLKLDESDYTRSTIVASIPVANVKTVDEKLDTHLKNADFFDAENFPKITFESKSLRRGDKHLELVGDLTIRGTTREVVLAIDGPTPEQTDPWGNVRIGASATTKIKRSDFNMTWNTVLEAGGVVVGDDISIALDVELIKQK